MLEHLCTVQAACVGPAPLSPPQSCPHLQDAWSWEGRAKLATGLPNIERALQAQITHADVGNWFQRTPGLPALVCCAELTFTLLPLWIPLSFPSGTVGVDLIFLLGLGPAPAHLQITYACKSDHINIDCIWKEVPSTTSSSAKYSFIWL